MNARKSLFRSKDGLRPALFSAALLTCSAATGAPNDYALINGKVYTGSGWASAVGISGDHILAVGDAAEVKKALPLHARLIDLKGATVLPGLHDMHVHPPSAGSLKRQCHFVQESHIEAISDAIVACVRTAKPGQWILGGRWTASALEADKINRKTLDQVAGGHPVALTDTSGHSLWANSAALTAARITKATPDPDGGIIEKDAAGEPTGVLRDSAAALLRAAMPVPGAQDVVEDVQSALSEMAQYGVTTLVDAAVDDRSLPAYMTLAARSELKQHVRGCLLWRKDSSYFETTLAKRADYRRERFKLDCVKIFMDGVPTESHTAAMLEPYVATPGTPAAAPPSGFLMVKPDVLNPLVTRLDRLGVVVKFHAAGDAAVRTAMDAIAAARAANGPAGPHHEVGHLPYVDPADMARAKPLGLTLEFSPYLWFPQPIVADMEKAVGPERNLRAWPVKEGLATGADVVAGSDWPVVPTVNPWVAIETLVTRKVPGGAGSEYGGREAITLQQAIELFTVDGARQFGDSDDKGLITAGAQADLVVIDRNPFDLPITSVHEIRTLYTIINGSIVYEAAASSLDRPHRARAGE